jgi:hypothetical protein
MTASDGVLGRLSGAAPAGDQNPARPGTLDPARAPIFVVGTGRSGTTLLRFMLCAHPRIYIAHETGFYLFESLYPRKAARRQFLDYYFRTASFRWLRVDAASVLAGLPDPLPRERTADAFTAIMRLKAAQYGRVRYGDKTPAHAAYLRRIFADYPEARVIYMVRDPRSVSLSLSRTPWGSASLGANARYCADDVRKVAPFLERLLAVRLEDLLGEPRGTMERILDFVGEPWDEAVLDHATHIPDAHDMPPFPWLDSAARPREAPVTAWRSLSPAQIRMIERAAGRVMTEFGYEPARLSREPGRAAVWWAGAREFPAWLRAAIGYIRLGLRARRMRGQNDERMNQLWRLINPGAWALYPGFEVPTPPPLPSSEATPSAVGERAPVVPGSAAGGT